MRSHLEAAKLVACASTEDDYVSSYFIDSKYVLHYLLNYWGAKNNGIKAHIDICPEAMSLPFYNASIKESKNEKSKTASPAGVKTYSMSYNKKMFNTRSLLHNGEEWGIAHSTRDFLLALPFSAGSLTLIVFRRIILTVQALLYPFNFFNI